MANKSFITARIPEELNEKLEFYAEAKGESKTNILVNALNKYLNFDNPKSDTDINLEDRVKDLENYIDKNLKDIGNRINELEELKMLLMAFLKNNRQNNAPQELSTAAYKEDKEVRYLPPGQPTAQP